MKKLAWFAVVVGTTFLLSIDQAHAGVFLILDSTGKPTPVVQWGVPHVNRVPVTSQILDSGILNVGGVPDWDAIAFCESHGNWATNTGNGYWGGLQFAPSTWFSYGGGPFDGSGPFPYSREEQIAVAERVLAAQGPGAWPSCYRST